MPDLTSTQYADAEALCNLRGQDPNDESAWNDAVRDVTSGAVTFNHPTE